MTSIKHGENIANLRQYLQDEENISSQDFDGKILKVCSEIFQRCPRGELEKRVKGLIYGHIQSGKTAVILTTMALAADNGYKNFIVMTSNLNDIYDQTLDRIKSSLDSFQVLGKKDFKKKQPTVNVDSPLVLVTSKHRATLETVINIARRLDWQHSPVMIIDDEADQASLDTNINDQTKPISAINQEITKLRDLLSSHSYLQTTATPQALLLQDKDSAFKPDFVVTTIEGTGYVGGNYFFGKNEEDSVNSDHICIVPDDDVTALTALTSSSQLPVSIKKSILVFLLGATTLRLKGHPKRYTYLLHTSHKQSAHEDETLLIDHFISELKSQLKMPISQMLSSLRSLLEYAHTELQGTFSETISLLPELLKEVKIISTEVLTINASSKEPLKPPTRQHTIYIGGTRLGRGVTIKNLLVTYYGRDAQNAQMDTVLQHARMYGYRQNELPVIRIYLPQNLAARFYDIHRIDDALREMCQEEHQVIRVIPLTENVKRPTRPNILNQNTVDLCTYLGGVQYFPHLPISSPEELGNQTEELDRLLPDYNEKEVYDVTVDKILQVLNFKFATPSRPDTWKDELIRKALVSLKQMPKYGNRATLVIINRGANLHKAKSRGFEEISGVIPESTQKKLKDEVSYDYPALFMTRNKGESGSAGGWHGVPFWIPVVQFPKGHYAFTVNYS